MNASSVTPTPMSFMIEGLYAREALLKTSAFKAVNTRLSTASLLGEYVDARISQISCVT